MADPAALQYAPALAPAAPTLTPTQSVKPAVDPEAQQATDNFKRNQAWVLPGENTYYTPLTAPEELSFRSWVADKAVPFDPDAKTPDYDMRGYWKDIASRGQNEQKKNPNDNKMHFPDTYKTPYHKSFSSESRHADPDKAPKWNNKDQLVLPDGTVVYDERAASKAKS